MGPNTDKLLSVSSGQIAPGHPSIEPLDQKFSTSIQSEIAELIGERNGFFCFESALHFFSAQTHSGAVGIADWNVGETWKYAYLGRADQLFCFAEDVFGNQFAVSGLSIVLFNAETAETSEFAVSIDDWAKRILSDYDFLTGYTFARDWQARHGALGLADRLCPKTPFVMGGEYSIENLWAGDRTKVLTSMGNFATQVAGRPDGSRVRLVVK